jgi:3'-phosphoadenosine 5'-phosphosulfate sulfotransferase (PAPS reductase)/FAD synthetase
MNSHIAQLVETAHAEISAAIEGRRFALQFSGGKDSLACLQLLKPWWDRLIVLWSNMGDPFPETVEQMQGVRKLVAEFHEIRGNSFDEASRAYPVDLLSLRATPLGRTLEPDGAKVTLRNRYDCCWSNSWLPMTNAAKALGIELLIRGQRDSESERAPIQKDSRDPSGAAILLPLKLWQQEDVFSYLKQEGVTLPRTYQFIRSSVDCMHCTAWLGDKRGKLEYLRRFHPVVAQEYEKRLALIGDELKHEVTEAHISLLEVSSNIGRNEATMVN